MEFYGEVSDGDDAVSLRSIPAETQKNTRVEQQNQKGSRPLFPAYGRAGTYVGFAVPQFTQLLAVDLTREPHVTQ
jgi:hypothetical protein